MTDDNDVILRARTGIATPESVSDLLPTERWLVAAMQQVGFGRLESLQIRDGQLILYPPPLAIRDIKFAALGSERDKPDNNFKLKRQFVELFEYVRSLATGEIRTLFIRHGAPFGMEIQVQPETPNTSE